MYEAIDDPYCYPGTTVLKNKLGLRKQSALAAAEPARPASDNLSSTDTDPEKISQYVAVQIARFEAGGALENVVDLVRGY